MKTARSHLYQYDVSIEDAYHFVYSNLNNPQIIYDTCLAYGVTNSMLAEIVNIEMSGVTKAQVIDFFIAMTLILMILMQQRQFLLFLIQRQILMF